MSASGKKNKKNKFRAVKVEEIFKLESSLAPSSWADEVETERLEDTYAKDITLPSAPRSVCDVIVDETKIPANGPYEAKLSNLPFDVTEDEVSETFSELKVKKVRLIYDDRKRMRGNGVVEFQDKSSLIVALQGGQVKIKTRPVRVELPDEAQSSDRGSSSGSAFGNRSRDFGRFDKTSDSEPKQWRVQTPVPNDPDKAPAQSKSSSLFGRNQNRDSAIGDRDQSGGFRDRPTTGGFKNFQPAAPAVGFSRMNRDKNENDSIKGGTFSRFSEDRPPLSRTVFGKRFTDDKEMRRDSMPERKIEEPKQRPKLEVLPRTIPMDVEKVPLSLPNSIFGGAKPVDTAKREAEIEAKLIKTSAPLPASISEDSRPSLRITRRRDACDNEEISNNENENEGHSKFESQNDTTNINTDECSNQESVTSNTVEEPIAPVQNVWKRRAAAVVTPTESSHDNASKVTSEEMTVHSEKENEAPTSDTTAVAESNAYVHPHSDNRSNDLPENRKWTSYSKDSFDDSVSKGRSHYTGNRDNRRTDRDGNSDYKYGSFSKNRNYDNRNREEGSRSRESYKLRNTNNTEQRSEKADRQTSSYRNDRNDNDQRSEKSDRYGGSYRNDRNDRFTSNSNSRGGFNSSRNNGASGSGTFERRRNTNSRIERQSSTSTTISESATSESHVNETTHLTPVTNNRVSNSITNGKLHEDSTLVNGVSALESNEDDFTLSKKHKKKKNNAITNVREETNSELIDPDKININKGKKTRALKEDQIKPSESVIKNRFNALEEDTEDN